MGEYEEKLRELRRELNEQDREILAAAAKRKALSLQAAELKQQYGRPVLDLDREGELLCRLGRESGEPEVTRELYQTLLRQSRRAQRDFAAEARKRDARGSENGIRAKYGLLGASLPHSLSPQVHKLLGFPFEYSLIPLSESELAGFLQTGGFQGLNVTIPYKETVLPFCSRLSPEAAAIGAVNTLRREADGSISGFNTDAGGFRYSLRRLEFDPRGKLCLVLGSGGAARMARSVLENMGARVQLISRKGPADYSCLEQFPQAALLVNATPVGMYPYGDECPADLDRLPGLEAVLDLVYRPYSTGLVLQAGEKNIKALGGLPMLVAQAQLSERIWKGEEPGEPEEALVEQAVEKLLKQGQNLVLIGMPGAGKSTQARILGSLLKRPVFDSDDAFRYLNGMTPGRFIESFGEEAFRQEESVVIRELSRKEGVILSTGGGAVLRPENRRFLRQNGRIVLLTRPLEKLSTFDRPLSRDAAALERLERERLPLYRELADAEVPVDGRKKETALEIIRAVLGEEYLPRYS